jgi:hypothetical protein
MNDISAVIAFDQRLSRGQDEGVRGIEANNILLYFGSTRANATLDANQMKIDRDTEEFQRSLSGTIPNCVYVCMLPGGA